MSTELSCWQGFWNFLCCGACYDDPQVQQQRKPLLKDQHQGTGVSHHRPPPVSTHDSYQRPPSDRTVGGLSIQQVEVQTGSHGTPDPVVVKRDEEMRRSPSSSPVLDRQRGGSSSVVVKDEEEKESTPPMHIPVVVDRSESDEDHTPPQSDVSQPVTPPRSPKSRSASPISSPYHDTSFGSGKVDFRIVSADHESPHKKAQKKEKKGVEDRGEHSD